MRASSAGGPRRWVAVACWFGVIFAFSSLPGPAIPGPVTPFSAVAHFTEYCVLAVLLVRATGWRPPGVRLLLALLLVCSLWGVSDEFHQYFTPGRTPDSADWATDTVGAAAGLAIMALVRRRAAGTGSGAGDLLP